MCCCICSTGTSQAYSNTALPIYSNAGHQHLPHEDPQNNLTLSHDIQTESHDLQIGSHDAHHYTNSESDVSTYSDAFPTMYSSTGHAQTSDVAASYPPNIFQAEVIKEQTSKCPPPTVVNSIPSHSTLPTHSEITLSTHSQFPLSIQSQFPLTTPSQVPLSTPHTGQMEQFQILYDARGRRINQLTQQLSATTDDSERHIRILRHEKVCVCVCVCVCARVCIKAPSIYTQNSFPLLK